MMVRPASSPSHDPYWINRVEAIAPRNDKLAWLKVAWMPGDPWQPVERWVVYEMIPRWRLERDIRLPDLMGPNPRTKGTFVNGVFKPATSTINETQWKLFQETGCCAQLLWIVQGSNGGHKREFTHTESSMLRMKGLPGEPAAPGDLPYAPVDRRVYDKLLGLDTYRQWKRMSDFAERKPEQIDADEQEQIIAMRAQMFDWLESQVVNKHYDSSDLKKIYANAPRNPGARLDFDQMKHELITQD